MSKNAPVRLIPLICPSCQTPLPAQVEERAWVCPTCQHGLLLVSDGSLCPQEIFFSDQIKPGAKGRPYWVSLGTVTVIDRSTYKGNQSKDAEKFWGAPRLFFIPAYEASLDDVVASGVQMLRSPLQVNPGPPMPFEPVVVPPEDLHALAEFMVYSLEADRKDALKTLKFNLRFEKPQLWII